MRDTMLFYRSFYEAINELNAEHRATLYDAIFEYGLNFKEPQLTGICKTIWTLIKPQIDANIKRFQNGKQPKDKQTGSKTEANNKQDESKPEANNNNNNNNNNNFNNNKNNNKELNILFDVFWNLYDKKVSKQKAEAKWNKLKDDDRVKIIDTLPAFLARIKDKQFQPNPDTYLNNRRWEDELPATKPANDEERHHDYRRYNNFEEYIYTCQSLKITPRFTKEEFYAM